MSRDVQIRSRTMLRSRMPGDGSVESWLTVELARAAAASKLGIAGVVVRERAVELVDPRGPAERGIGLPTLLGGLTTTVGEHGAVEAVGVWGEMNRRGRGREVPVVAVFLEWADCRGWMWEALTSGGAILEPTVVERSAIAGDSLPGGIGRYWTWARRSGVKMEVRGGLVH